MRLGTRASVFAAASLLACSPIGAAYATVESPSPTSVESPSPTPSAQVETPTPTPSAVESPTPTPPTESLTPTPSAVEDEATENAAGTEMQCKENVSDDTVTIQFEPPAAPENITVTADGERLEFDQAGSTSIVVQRPESNVMLLLEVWDAENQQEASCQVELPGLAESPEPTEPGSSEPNDPSESPEVSPTPTPTPPSEPDDTPEPSTPASPTEPSPTQPDPSGQTPPAPQTPTTPAPAMPYSTPDAPSTPTQTSPDTASPSDSLSPDDSDRHVPRHIRPHAESPRYLLPQLLGIESHRGSPLVMPRPRETGDPATELETLPPISEHELEAIKAQLSSPGRADNTRTGAHLESTAPTQRVSDQHSWWLIAGLTSVIGISAVAWWLLNRRKRQH